MNMYENEKPLFVSVPLTPAVPACEETPISP